MVKTPRTRHSRTGKEPVTIDLGPDEVSRVKAKTSSATTPAPEGKDAAPQTAGDTARTVKATQAEPGPAKTEQTDGKTARTKASEPAKPSQPDLNQTELNQPGPVDGTAKAAAAKAEPSKTDGRKPDGPKPPFGRQDRNGSATTPPERPSASAKGRDGKGGGRGGGLSAAIAGLVGGIAALALAAGLQYAGVLQQVAPSGPSEVADHGPAIAALETQLGELRSEIAAFEGTGDDDTVLSSRLSEVETQLATLASELNGLREEVAAGATAAGTTSPDEMAATDLAPLIERIATLETTIADLPDQSAAQSAVSALRGEVEAGRAQINSRLDALERAVDTLGNRVEDQAQAPATALIIAASSLKAAVERGTTFATELDTYAALAPGAPQLEELRPLAANGVPTRAQIAAASDAAANSMIAASRPVDPQAGIGDRLWNSMMGLVQVRPIGMVEGEGVPEIVARMDAAVQQGDYERALAEYDTLPPEARSAGEGFVARLRARHTADRLVDEALAAALVTQGKE